MDKPTKEKKTSGGTSSVKVEDNSAGRIDGAESAQQDQRINIDGITSAQNPTSGNTQFNSEPKSPNDNEPRSPTSGEDPKSPTDKSKKTEEKIPPIKFAKLYRYANKYDILMMIFGTLFSIANGVIMPLYALIFGGMTNSFDPSQGYDELIRLAKEYTAYFMYAGIAAFVSALISVSCWMLIGERQTINIRREYFRALLRQEIGYFDSINPNELSTKIANDCQLIWQGIGEKVQTFISSFAQIIAGFAIGFSKGWQLSLMMLVNLPVIFIGGSFYVWAIQKSTKKNLEAYEKSGGVAEQALTAIKTVVALSGEEKEVRNYKRALTEAKKIVIKYGFMGGIFIGILLFAVMFCYALGLFYGSYLIENETYNPVNDGPYTFGDVIGILFANLMAAFSISQATTPLKSFALAKEAGARAMKVIDRKSQIDIESTAGETPELTGRIEFVNVEFAYPSKKHRKILKGVNFVAEPRQKIALVGESGCGKTTCMQLIERFYDADAGDVLFDGKSIKSINLKWLRENIGYVGQEPAMFATSIRENLRFAKPDATEEQMWAALRDANIDEFIRGLEKGLDTFVGSGGAQLSGGQKQRIAIARAMLKNPKILLLDEATSALDRKNEISIQKTLDEISKDRTTIVIAHRLSTIQNSDVILVFNNGVIEERGKHAELLKLKGKYYDLTHHQVTHHHETKTHEHKLVKKPSTKHEQEITTTTKIETQIEAVKKMSPLDVIDNEFIQMKDYFHPGDESVPPFSLNLDIIQEEPKSPKSDEIEGDDIEPVADTESPIKSAGAELIVKKTEEKKEEKKELSKKEVNDIQKRLEKYGKGTKPFLYFAFFLAMCNGAVWPASSILIARLLEVLALPDDPDFRWKSNELAFWLLMLGVFSMVLQPLEKGIYAIVGEKITTGIRTDVFAKMLRMHIGWFDLPEHSPGALASKLATDATMVNQLTTTLYGVIMAGVGSLLCGIGIAFSGSWQLTLVALAIMPIMMLAGKCNAQQSQGFSSKHEASYTDANGYLSEALNNMRTVASFAREDVVLKQYNQKLDAPLREVKRKSWISGFSMGFSEFMRFAVYAVIFIAGAYFVRDIDLSISGMFTAMFGILYGAFGAGNAMQFLPEVGAARQAAIGLIRILDTPSEIDINDTEGKITKPIKGEIVFENVSFKYPTRDHYVFKNLNFTVHAFDKVALVGSSGCGKSTVVQLIMRFYDALGGRILLDGEDIRKYDLKYLRQSIGIVSQEPVLFNGTIEENIK